MQISCHDQLAAIKAALATVQNNQLIILTGGLGPTVDDITRNAVAEFLELPLVENDVAKSKIESYFKRSAKNISANNYQQAYFPDGAVRLDNQKGTADGFYLKKNDKLYLVLPGPKNELEYVFEQHGLQLLAQNQEPIIHTYKLFGIGESVVDQSIGQYLVNTKELTSGIYVSGSIISIVLIEWQTTVKNQQIIANLETIIKDKFGDYYYADSDIDLIDSAVQQLIANNISISFGESCTGGMLAANLTARAGVSAIFKGSVVTYADSQKQQLLAVDSDILAKYGAVSEECCLAMLAGVKKRFGSDMSVAITGIAGPDGGSTEKPVGLVYIGIDYRGNTKLFKEQFSGDRNRIRNKAMLFTYFNILKLLE